MELNTFNSSKQPPRAPGTSAFVPSVASRLRTKAKGSLSYCGIGAANTSLNLILQCCIPIGHQPNASTPTGVNGDKTRAYPWERTQSFHLHGLGNGRRNSWTRQLCLGWNSWCNTWLQCPKSGRSPKHLWTKKITKKTGQKWSKMNKAKLKRLIQFLRKK